MAKLTKFLGGTALAVLGATTASAGGMEVRISMLPKYS